MSWSELCESPFQERQKTSGCFYEGSLFLFGGENKGSALNDLWEFSGGSWRRLDGAGDAPPPIWSHTLVGVGGKLVVYGGEMVGQSFSSVFWVFDLASGRWSKPSPPDSSDNPGERRNHAACALGGEMLVFGGEDENGERDDVFSLDVGSGAWRRWDCGGDAPRPRKRHSLVVDGNLRRAFVFGGWEGRNMRGGFWEDLYVLDLETKEWEKKQIKGASPGPRGCHLAAAMGDKMLIWGGVGERDKMSRSAIFWMSMKDLDFNKVRVLGFKPEETFLGACGADPEAQKFYVMAGGVADGSNTKKVFVCDLSSIY